MAPVTAPSSLRLSLLDIYDEAPTRPTTQTTIDEFRSGRPLVVDFWHLKCSRCPASLAQLESDAATSGVPHMACAIATEQSQAEAQCNQVMEVLTTDESKHSNLWHAFMTYEQKELAKAAIGFTSVPWCAIFAADGSLAFSGPPCTPEMHRAVLRVGQSLKSAV